jgi:hypothetical protein
VRVSVRPLLGLAAALVVALALAFGFPPAHYWLAVNHHGSGLASCEAAWIPPRAKEPCFEGELLALVKQHGVDAIPTINRFSEEHEQLGPRCHVYMHGALEPYI